MNNNNYNNQIKITYNTNNYLLLKYGHHLDILKNYYEGNYFYIYDQTKIELELDYLSKVKLTIDIKEEIIEYRNNGIKILITE